MTCARPDSPQQRRAAASLYGRGRMSTQRRSCGGRSSARPNNFLLPRRRQSRIDPSTRGPLEGAKGRAIDPPRRRGSEPRTKRADDGRVGSFSRRRRSKGGRRRACVSRRATAHFVRGSCRRRACVRARTALVRRASRRASGNAVASARDVRRPCVPVSPHAWKRAANEASGRRPPALGTW
jgi:hypothetical protein